MISQSPAPVSLLGLGAMGHALASSLLDAGHRVTVWNRTPGRADRLVHRGATEATTVNEAVTQARLIAVCLYDAASVQQALSPAAADLRGRAVVNLTSTTPDEARGLSAWAAEHGIGYLDGAIMATPDMIGSAEAAIFYSGSRRVFEAHRGLLDTWATSTYEGEDAGTASLLDLAMLSGMYTMFAGFLHGAAMVRAGGIPVVDFAERAAPFLAAMTGSLPEAAKTVDGGEYNTPAQSLDWTLPVLDAIARSSREQSVDPAPVDVVRRLVRRQIHAGHGPEDFERIIESLHVPGAGEDNA